MHSRKTIRCPVSRPSPSCSLQPGRTLLPPSSWCVVQLMVREMVKETDVDNNMQVSYDEFLPWCPHARPPARLLPLPRRGALAPSPSLSRPLAPLPVSAPPPFAPSRSPTQARAPPPPAAPRAGLPPPPIRPSCSLRRAERDSPHTATDARAPGSRSDKAPTAPTCVGPPPPSADSAESGGASRRMGIESRGPGRTSPGESMRRGARGERVRGSRCASPCRARAQRVLACGWLVERRRAGLAA
jgi:hypothetical protein